MKLRTPIFIAMVFAFACNSDGITPDETATNNENPSCTGGKCDDPFNGKLDDPGSFCGDEHGTARPELNPQTDLPALLTALQTYTANPQLLYTGVWTNWYEELNFNDSLAKLAVMRGILDNNSLWDMYPDGYPSVGTCPDNAAFVRQIDGTCNDPDNAAMGAAGIRMGRNTRPNEVAAFPDTANLMEPSPREVSRVLFTRDEFKPVPFLNLLAAAWIQFEIHDWFNHTNTELDWHEVPLSADDPLRSFWTDSMRIQKTAPDDSRDGSRSWLAPSFQNEVTHWWDGSQLYGSDEDTAGRLRSYEGGRLLLEAGMLPVGDDGKSDAGFNNNWWIGLELLHTIFAQEHNAIADMLAQAYPSWTDQTLYDTARMINAALIAKIHTLEWTPAVLPNPVLGVGMETNWNGLNQYFSPQFDALPPGLPSSFEPVMFGVVGGKRDMKVYPSAEQLMAIGASGEEATQLANAYRGDVPYFLTEEFASVYRLHSLLPDSITVVSASSGARGATWVTEETRDDAARKLMAEAGLTDVAYTFGTQNPGALVLRNYPGFLQNLDLPLIGPLDIGTVDVLRDRERGVPRFNEFRRQLFLKPLSSLEQLTDDPELLARLQQVYGTDADAIERVDLLVGTLAEGQRPTCYGFGETLFQVFTLMATRRLQADRFYTDDFNATVYTPEGMAWIEQNSMKSILLRHIPELASTGLSDVTNAFYPWP